MSINPPRFLRTVFGGLLDLVYPSLCLNCQRPIHRNAEPALCLPCYNRLERTEQWHLPENATTDQLAGRLPLVFGAAYYFFTDGSPVQALIHGLKYQGRPEIGTQIGRAFGRELREIDRLRDLTGIVPVPIHAKRRQQRGYNQAEYIATGLGEALGVPVYKDALRRTSFKGSQTKLSIEQRVDNVRRAFANGAGRFDDGHLLLVDDVLTTGATLDFCGQLLLKHHPGLRLSIATLAIASK